MRKALFASIALAVLVPAAPSQAQDVERYRLERTENGFVRMDTRTGVMSSCEESGGQLVCRPAADERAAYSALVDDMERRIEELEGRIAALEGAPARGVPSEQEFEQSLTFMERFFRRFMDVMKDFDREFRDEGPASEEAPPQRS